MWSRIFGLVALLACVLLVSATANAASKSWNGTIDANWSSPGNWTPSGVPNATDDVTISNTGNAPVVDAPFSVHNLLVNGGATITLNAALTVDGTGTPATVTNQGTMTGSSQLALLGATTIQIVSSFSCPLEVDSGAASALGSTLSGPVTITSGGNLQLLNGQVVNLSGDLELNSGGILSGATTSGQVNFAGTNLVDDGSITVPEFRFSGGAAQTWSGAGTLSPTSQLVVLSGSTATLIGNVAVTNTILNVNGGTLAAAGNTLTLNGVNFFNSGNCTSTSGGKFSTQGATFMQIGGTFTTALEINSNTTTFNGSTLSSNITVLNGANLQVNFNQTVNVLGDLTINSGGTISGANSATTVDFDGANFVNNGTVTVSVFQFNGTAQSWSGTGSFSPANQGLVQAGSSTTLASSVAISSTTFSVVGGGTLATGANTLTLNGVGFTNQGTSSSGAGGKISTKGATTLSVGGTFTAALEVNRDITAANTCTFSGPITVLSGANFQIVTNQTVTANNDVTINTGGSLTDAIPSTIFLFKGTNFINNGTVSSRIFEFNGSGVQNWSGAGLFSPSSDAFVIAGSTTTLASDITVTNTNLTVQNGGTLAIGSHILTLNGAHLTNSNGLVTTTGAGKIVTSNGASLTAVGTTFTGSLDIGSGTTTISLTSTLAGPVTVENGAILQVSDNQTLFCTGDLTIAAGGTLSGTNASTSVEFQGANFVNNGTVTIPQFSFSGGAQNWSGSGAFSPSAQSLVQTGSVTSLASSVTVSNTSFRINGGTLAVGDNTLTLNAVTFVNVGTFTSTSSGKLSTQGATSLSVSGTFSGSLEVDSGVTTVFNSTFAGPITIANGGNFQLSNAQIVNVNGDLTVQTGGTLSSVNNGPIVNFGGSTLTNSGTISVGQFHFTGATQSWSGAGLFSPESQGAIQSGAAVTLAGDVTISNTSFTVEGGGSLAVGGNTVTLDGVIFTNFGTVTSSAAGKLITKNTTSLSVAGAFSGSLEVNSGITTVFNSTFGGTIGILSGANLQLSNAQVINANGDLTVNAGGTLSSVNSSPTLNFAGGNLVNNGTITVGQFRFTGTGTQNWSGAGTFSPGASGTVVAGSATTLTSDITVGTTAFNISSGASMDVGAHTLTLDGVNFTNTGTFTSTAAGKLVTKNTTSLSVAGSFTGSLEVNSGITTLFNSTFGGTITILSGANLQLANAQVVQANGDVTINAGGKLSDANGNAQFLFGSTNLVNNGLITVTQFEFDGGTQNLSGTGSFSAETAIIQTGSTTTLASDHHLSTVVIEGGTFDISGRTLFLSGAGTALTKNGTLNATGSTIEYDGTAAQSLSLTSVNFNNLSINNTAGVSVPALETVPGTLALLSGALTTGGNLTLGTGALIRRSDGSLNGAPLFGSTVNVEYFGVDPIATGAELPAVTAVLHDLTMNDTNTVTLSDAHTVNGTLFLNNGSFGNGANLTLANNATIQRSDGILGTAPNFGTSVNVIYAGANPIATGPELPVSAAVLGALTNNNTNGVSLNASATVNGALTLNGANINAGANTLTVAGTGTLARTSGFVVGNLQKQFISPGAFTYAVGTAPGDYSPVNATVTAGAGNLSVKAAGGQPPVVAPGHTIQRYWTLNGGGVTTNLVFHYLDGDVLGNESAYRIIRISGGTPISFDNNCGSGSPCVDTINNAATINGVQNFSDWTVGESLAPTAAGATISGRVLSANGQPIGNALVVVTKPGGETVTAQTGPFGYYTFSDLPTGQLYVLSVGAGRFTFTNATRAIQLTNDELTTDFIADP